MSEIYFTIAGTNHWHGQEFIEPGMKEKLVKEPDNEVDSEAIKVEMPGIGQIGYVANSPYTVIGETSEFFEFFRVSQKLCYNGRRMV